VSAVPFSYLGMTGLGLGFFDFLDFFATVIADIASIFDAIRTLAADWSTAYSIVSLSDYTNNNFNVKLMSNLYSCDIGYRNRLIRQKASLAINESRNVPSITVLDSS